MKGGIRISGLAELDRSLKDLGNHLSARRIARRVLTEASKPMVDLAIALAPDDPATPIGLKQSIKVATAKSSSLRRKFNDASVAGIILGIDSEVQEPTTYPRENGKGSYRDPGVAGVATIQEFGTSKMAANPFMRPAFDAQAEATLGRVVTIMTDEVAKAANRLKK